jgi:hypothetical protein
VVPVPLLILLRSLKMPRKRSVNAKTKSLGSPRLSTSPGGFTPLPRLLNKSPQQLRNLKAKVRRKKIQMKNSDKTISTKLIPIPIFKMGLRLMASKIMSPSAAPFLYQ